MTIFHVAATAAPGGDGTKQHPFTTITAAARVAVAGDTVEVGEGTYREWVKPSNPGISESRRVTFRAANGTKPVIKGSEIIDTWIEETDGVWRVELPNEFFGDFNPYSEILFGDWLLSPAPEGPHKHLGEVYLNGEAFFEVTSLEDVKHPLEREAVRDDWTGVVVDPQTYAHHGRVWYCEVDAERTKIWANFGSLNPNNETTEINVRRSVFFPVEAHVDYITVSGFEMAHAATPWAPPTGDQPGLIGPKWAKGWIIENNRIHNAKCSAVSLGKDATTGDNYHQKRWDKPGYQYQLESVFEAYMLGWSKERIGSHTVRNNEIYDCGQNGIVGHLGCVFSRIENNHIHHVATRREYFGHEIGGIKLHAPIDTVIAQNRIHDCTLGIWLDWEIQGTRISRNVLYRNNRDIFLEVSHGPYIVDFNVFGSKAAVENVAQGGAYVHNLLLGTLRQEHVRDRATPYHLPHSTAPKGYAVIEGGDDRYRGNIFAGETVEEAYDRSLILPDLDKSILGLGTDGFADFPATMAEYIEARKAYGNADHMAFLGALQPIELRDNAYAGSAKFLPREDGALSLRDAKFSVVEEGDCVYLETSLPTSFDDDAQSSALHDSYPPTRFSYAEFEDADGSPVSFLVDITGDELGSAPSRGPFAALASGSNRVKIWG